VDVTQKIYIKDDIIVRVTKVLEIVNFALNIFKHHLGWSWKRRVTICSEKSPVLTLKKWAVILSSKRIQRHCATQQLPYNYAIGQKRYMKQVGWSTSCKIFFVNVKHKLTTRNSVKMDYWKLVALFASHLAAFRNRVKPAGLQQGYFPSQAGFYFTRVKLRGGKSALKTNWQHQFRTEKQRNGCSQVETETW